ncbi:MULTISPECIES: hypothetical protein [unclassified Brevundimonas]|uniref:hypothetical protein n=1 Tax=unclassified Brevundimonas TaxID=2622653 RepID=UPI0025C3BABF|nr:MULTISPECIES: hypothetical protein [unclassified Brevundimonas]
MNCAGWVISAAVLCLGASSAAAQALSDRDWTVTVSPYVWAKTMQGRVQGAGLSTPVHVPFSEAFEKVEGVFMGEVAVDGPRWGAYVDYQGTDSRDERIALGLPIEADIRLRSLTGAVYYVAHEEELGGRTVHGAPRLLRIRPLAGARWSRTRADLAVPGLIEVGKQAEWTDVIVGLRTDADLNDRWKLTGHLDVGGFDPGERFSLNAQATLGYRTTVLTRPVLLRVGYAVLFQEYEQGDFTGDRFVWNMTGHGPMAGFSITF